MAWYTVDGHFYCPACIKIFIQSYHQEYTKGPFNIERASMMHCERREKCINTIGKVGACLVGQLTAEGRIGVAYELDNYVKYQSGVPEILDAYASILETHPLDGLRLQILHKYREVREEENKTCQTKHRTQTDCKSCKGTGIVLGLNKTYPCLDCV